MTTKLNQILESEHLTATKLAEILEIQPSGISHILRSRNKPSYDFVVKLLRRFPRINPDWLLLDSDQMYRDDNTDNNTGMTNASAAPSSTSSQGTTLFDAPTAESDAKPSGITQFANSPEPARQISHTNKEVDRVIIFYTDQTCECYKNR